MIHTTSCNVTFELEDELPLVGFLSLCSLEAVVEELYTFLVEVARFEIAKLV